ncbi:hypothetical protein HY310_00430 [Candidatus Microgenomates bacterium]|nr:hypothetical protein [Candidatus Microgenomates bacterium]
MSTETASVSASFNANEVATISDEIKKATTSPEQEATDSGETTPLAIPSATIATPSASTNDATTLVSPSNPSPTAPTSPQLNPTSIFLQSPPPPKATKNPTSTSSPSIIRPPAFTLTSSVNYPFYQNYRLSDSLTIFLLCVSLLLISLGLFLLKQ